MKYALISCFDKTGLEPLAIALQKAGYGIISTGNTAKAITRAGVDVSLVSDVTQFPEILGGRVKTLQPKIFGGILFRPDQEQEATQHNLPDIRLVVVNFYPFPMHDLSEQPPVELIDIGGPSMVRAAAKNWERVAVATNPGDYPAIIENLQETGEIGKEVRRELAAKAFAWTATYDSAIAAAFSNEAMPERFVPAYTLKRKLRYGENPHQSAGLYVPVSGHVNGVVGAEVLGGKALSYNNIQDAQAGWAAVSMLDGPGAVVLKHSNPCGAATADNILDAYDRALAGDPLSAFGGIIALNRTLTLPVAKEIVSRFFEVVMAPEFEPEALTVLRKKKRLRILKVPKQANATMEFRSVGDGLLVQQRDLSIEDLSQARVATKVSPTAQQMKDLAFAWLMVRFVKSNSVVLARDNMLVGVGAGQMSRVDSVWMALHKAGDRVKDSVMASDAFFPFADGLELAVKHGVTAVVQPGGSIRDQDVIDAADRLGIAMLMTGVRHFRH